MKIYNIQGQPIADVIITKSAVHEQELMKNDFVRLSWRDVEKRTFDVGTYIRPFADKGDDTPYFLFQPYEAEQVNEVEYKCEPEFHHPVMYLQYVPYTQLSKDYNGNDVTKIDWTYQGGTIELLQHICEAINTALRGANLLTSKEAFSVEILASNNTGIKDSTSVTFSAIDILSALSQIAQYNECEWHLSWVNKTLYFGDIRLGDDEVEPITLRVDENINVPSVRSDKEGWWNAYLPQGGTKNMTRTMPSGEIISASTRLELDKTTYPDGYIYTDKQGNVISKEAFIASGVKKIVKTLVFDYIFPKLDLYLYDIRERRRLRYEDDEETIPSKNADGSYEYYADWYFRLAYPVKDENGNITKWKPFDGLSSRIPKAQINTYEDGNVYVRIPFVVGRNVFTTPSTTTSAEYDVVAKIGDVETPAIVFGGTGDASIKHLRIPKFIGDEPTNYGKFMQLVVDGAKAMTFTQGVDNTAWSECAAEIGKLDDYTYSESLRINGTDIGGYFKANVDSDKYTSPLAGREFTIDYYDTNKEIKEQKHEEYGVIDTGIKISVGDYHIVREDGDIIIPTTSEGGLYPRGDEQPSTDNNIINLYNIQMTDDYVKNAQNDLANATLQEIKFFYTDNKTYTCKSNPVAFAKSNPNLYIGRKVTYVDTTGYTLSTRVMALTTQLDFPIEQEISLGNLVIKGTQQQMRENVEAIITGSIGAGGGGTLNKSAVENIIKQYSDKRYLSKLNDDTAKGEITFEKGAKFGSKRIDAQGNATLNDVTANRYKGKDGVVDLDGDTDISGDANVSGSIDITKNAIIGGNTQISGDVNVSGDATIIGSATLNDATASKYKGKNGVVNLDGNTEITGGMSVEGDTELDADLKVHGETQHDKSVKYGNYTGASVLDTGAAMIVDPNTKETTLIVDYARFRKKAEFTEITVAELKSVGGEIIISPAHMVIAKVEVLETGDYKCYFQNSDGDRTIKNQFAVDDQARCQVFNLDSGSRYYWRLVTEVGTDYIVLSSTDCNGTDIPQVGDNLCQLGNRTDATRQSAIILSAYGADAPSRKSYQGINSYDLTNCLAYGESYNPITGRNKSEIYGDAYIGDREKNEYIEYTQEEGLKVKGKVDVQMGANNLILNSSFEGDYKSETFSEETNLDEVSDVYSDRLTHWSYENVEIVSESGSYCKSGNAAVLTNGWLEQQVNNPPKSIAYVLSFSAKGEGDIIVFVNTQKDEYLRTISLNESWSRYSVDIKATSSEYIRVFFSASNAVICDIQLERGFNVTDWKPSEDDADDALNGLQTYAYLLDAIRNCNTSILGGLVMSKMLMLGNYKDGKLLRNTAGISGIYNNDDDVVLWGGGSYHDAIRIVAKFKNNPAYNPTEEEWQKLAKFAVTHGGDVFMRGYIHALGGYFRGMIDIADGKIRLNPDGSGHLANGNIEWNADGKVTFGEDVTLSWGSIEGTDNVATKTEAQGYANDAQSNAESYTNNEIGKLDIKSEDDIQNITKTTITKDYVESLEIKAVDIKGDTITGKTVQSTNNEWKLNNDGSGHLANGNIRWNAQGNAEFDGAVNAETLYRGICLVWDNQTYKILSKDGNYKTPVYLVNKENLLSFLNQFDLYDINAIIASINETDEGSMFYWGDNYFSKRLTEEGYQPKTVAGVKACTGSADVILLQNNATSEFKTGTIVYIPRAQDYVGKLIEVVNPKVEADSDIYIHQADDAQTFVLGVGLKDGGIETFVKFSEITIGSRTTRFYSDGTYWIKL